MFRSKAKQLSNTTKKTKKKVAATPVVSLVSGNHEVSAEVSTLDVDVNVRRDVQKMNRKELVQLCKRFSIKVKGKNEELVTKIVENPEAATFLKGKHVNPRLLEAIVEENSNSNLSGKDEVEPEIVTKNSPDITKPVTTDLTFNVPSENHASSPLVHFPMNLSDDFRSLNLSEDTILQDESKIETFPTKGWCVIEGMWKEIRMYQLVLKQARVLVELSENEHVPLVLQPSAKVLPELHDDNLVCQNCMNRNEVVRRRPRISDFSLNLKRRGSLQPAKEDPEFAEKIEKILESTRPGSEEERVLLFASKKSEVRLSSESATTQLNSTESES